jgi:hypothetical protein
MKAHHFIHGLDHNRMNEWVINLVGASHGAQHIDPWLSLAPAYAVSNHINLESVAIGR